MSRVAKAPVELPKGVEFKQDGNLVTLKGGNGELSLELNSEVELKQEDNVLTFAYDSDASNRPDADRPDHRRNGARA